MFNCIEKDYKILKPTQCRHLNHVFIWTSNGTSDNPQPEQPCDCGVWSWREYQKALNEVNDGLV